MLKLRNLTDEEKKKASMLAAGVAAGMVGSRAAQKALPDAFDGKFPGISASVLVSSSVVPQMANPAVTGLAAGRVIDFLVDKVAGGRKTKREESLGNLKRRLERIKQGRISMTEDKPYKKWDVKVYNIPNWLPTNIVYGMALDKIRGLIRNPSFNRVTKKWVPAAYMHPAVMYFAKEIVKNNGADGREWLKICRGVAEWTHLHVPWTGEFLGAEDMFMHPGLVLETMDANGICMPVDCDCQVALNSAMLLALGIPVYFVLVGQYPDEPGYNHIICAVKMPKEYWGQLKHPPFFYIDSTIKPGRFEQDYLPKYHRIMVRRV
jgi:hypothetical protein